MSKLIEAESGLAAAISDFVPMFHVGVINGPRAASDVVANQGPKNAATPRLDFA
jgi:hypothetical protein